MKTKKKFYAVREGRAIGVFETWEECKRQVDGYPGAVYKSFKTYEEAKAAMEKKDQQREETENKDDKEDVHPLPDDHKNIDDIPLNPPSEKKNSDEHNSDENKDK